jgi:hypothetical protein
MLHNCVLIWCSWGTLRVSLSHFKDGCCEFARKACRLQPRYGMLIEVVQFRHDSYGEL